MAGNNRGWEKPKAAEPVAELDALVGLEDDDYTPITSVCIDGMV